MAAHAGGSGAGMRLRWWVLALPIAAFGALLTLLLAGTDAQAADARLPLTELIAHLQDTLLPQIR